MEIYLRVQGPSNAWLSAVFEIQILKSGKGIRDDWALLNSTVHLYTVLDK